MNSSSRRSLWPFGIIMAFIVFIAGTAGLIVFASAQKVELVSPDYYEEELGFQKRIDGLDRAKNLGGCASVVYDRVNAQLRVSVPAEQAAGKCSGRIQFYRPSSTELDHEMKLAPDANGIQTISTAELERGLWKVQVSWTAGGQEYFVDTRIIVGETFSSTANRDMN